MGGKMGGCIFKKLGSQSFDKLRMTVDGCDATSHESPDSKPGQAVETLNSLLSFDRLRMTIVVMITSQHESPDSKPAQAVETLNSLLSFDGLSMTVDV